ncbi:phospho-N-acetylmuramoyl-pentapeptide-transferase [Candidatus Avelusimicrobium aviculae]|uniref:phospho-N-acetylmuramoyl-pentapeptide- transferase n=1 Tax=Candidatus Avelusimicrobium aviculae TaxID=3416206 RepID=UPI003D13C8CB
MLYYLTQFKDEFTFLNIFNYITFRTGAAVFTSFFISLLIGPAVVAKLRSYKIQQIEREYGPASHLSKSGTPTMGGLLILVSLLASVLLWARLDNPYIWLMIFTTVALASAGIMDDYTKLVKKNPEGMKSSVKFAIQLFTALVVVGYLGANPPNGNYATSVMIPYMSKMFVDLSVFYFAFSMLVIVGSSNATNLTDGLDGLAAGCMVFTAAAYGVVAYLAGNIHFADYLKIIYVPGAGEITVFMGALAGACIGFLWFNAYPAQVFMGDTSSLFLGGVIGTAALCVKQELLLPIAGGIFVLETLSVMLQMGYFKLTHGKRLFKMTPIHHHFELMGIAEPKVIVRFWIVGAMLMLLALASLKIR